MIPDKLQAMTDGSLLKIIKHNCDISDARDNGIYSICTLVLNGLPPRKITG
jgi:hypothetical protein